MNQSKNNPLEQIRKQIGRIRHTMADQIRAHAEPEEYEESFEGNPEQDFRNACDAIRGIVKQHQGELAAYTQISLMTSTLEGLWASLLQRRRETLELIQLYYKLFLESHLSPQEIDSQITDDFSRIRKGGNSPMHSSWVQLFLVEAKNEKRTVRGTNRDGSKFCGIPTHVETGEKGNNVWLLERRNGEKDHIGINDVTDLY